MDPAHIQIAKHEESLSSWDSLTHILLPVFTCPKLTIETLEQCMKYVQS